MAVLGSKEHPEPPAVLLVFADSSATGAAWAAECWLVSVPSRGKAGGHTPVLLPGLFSGELPECTQELMIDVTKSYYQKFLPLTQV